jgi:hypothetical protein
VRFPTAYTGEELRAAVEEWQAKHSRPDMPLQLTTGFLDGTSPVVDIYELKVFSCPLLAFFPSPNGDSYRQNLKHLGGKSFLYSPHNRA